MSTIDLTSAFEAPVTDLQEQLRAGVLQPHTQIPGALLEELQTQIPYDEDRWIRVGFVDVWKPISTRLTEETFAALYRVSMTGFEDLEEEPHFSQKTGFSTATVGLHIDDGTTHVVNLTVHGTREITARDSKTQKEDTITAVPGTISVVRTALHGGSLVSLPHSVKAERYGSALQQRVGFPHRSLRRNMPA